MDDPLSGVTDVTVIFGKVSPALRTICIVFRYFRPTFSAMMRWILSLCRHIAAAAKSHEDDSYDAKSRESSLSTLVHRAQYERYDKSYDKNNDGDPI